MSTTAFVRTDPRLGQFSLHPIIDVAADAPLLHAWLTHPKSVFWQLGSASQHDIEQQFTAIAADPDRVALLGHHEGAPTFLVERYDPRHSELRGTYAMRSGDIGMHFLVAPTNTPRHGFTRAVLDTVMQWLFATPGVQRVVVEPDVENHAVHALNAAVGFQVLDTLVLSDKHAYLSTCTRQQYQASHHSQEAPR